MLFRIVWELFFIQGSNGGCEEQVFKFLSYLHCASLAIYFLDPNLSAVFPQEKKSTYWYAFHHYRSVAYAFHHVCFIYPNSVKRVVLSDRTLKHRRSNMFSSFNGLIQEAQDHLFQKPASVYLLCSDPYTFLSTCTQALWITPLESHHHSNSVSPSDVVYTPHLAAQSIVMAGSSRELISPGQCSSTIPRSLFICDTKIPVLSPIHQF